MFKQEQFGIPKKTLAVLLYPDDSFYAIWKIKRQQMVINLEEDEEMLEDFHLAFEARVPT